jgi:hypothetical protein
MTKTAEEIVLSFLGDTPIRSPGALKAYADAVAVIQAYGDQRAAEARAEGIDIPKKPANLEKVAEGICLAAGVLWDGASEERQNLCRAQAGAAIEALKVPAGKVLSGSYGGNGMWQMPGYLFNLYLDSILADGQK